MRPALRRTLVLLAVLTLGAVGGGAATAALVRAGSPVRELLAQSTNPQGGDGRTLYLQRVTIPADTPLAAHFHQGTQIAAITSGRLRCHVITGRPVGVVRPDADGGAPAFVRAVKPGETYVVRAGQSVIEPAGSVHEVHAMPGEDVVIYVASLFTNGAPLSDPYMGDHE
jgi:quercetin dioxygenase-like cupin family protein